MPIKFDEIQWPEENLIINASTQQFISGDGSVWKRVATNIYSGCDVFMQRDYPTTLYTSTTIQTKINGYDPGFLPKGIVRKAPTGRYYGKWDTGTSAVVQTLDNRSISIPTLREVRNLGNCGETGPTFDWSQWTAQRSNFQKWYNGYNYWGMSMDANNSWYAVSNASGGTYTHGSASKKCRFIMFIAHLE
jgi:hypothetical protein